jgi:DNA-binding Lrp family transcriptional regulator
VSEDKNIIPDKTILADVHGWTPLIDNLVREYGLITAAVFGVAWRHCQMRNGICTASQERLAEMLGITRRSVIKHMAKLVIAGYLCDQTPSIKNRPHVYSDTGKAALIAEIGVNKIHTPGMNEIHRSVNDIHLNTLSSTLTTSTEINPAAASADTIRSEFSSENSSLPRNSVHVHIPHKNANIEMMWKVWGFYPPRKIIPSLIKMFADRIGPDNLLNEELLNTTVIDWIARGWNPKDYTRIFKNYFEKNYYMDPNEKFSTLLSEGENK